MRIERVSIVGSFIESSTFVLPPGPLTYPVIGKLLWLTKSFGQIEPILRDFKLKYGPLICLKIGSRPSIFISSHSLAHRTLVQNGAVFSDRPKPPPTGQITSSNQHNISSASYGPTWRLFRRNLTSEILHPSRVKSYSHARLWVLDVLLRRLHQQPDSTAAAPPVKVVDHLQYAMFCLLVLMCFGDKLREDQIKEIERCQRRMLLSFGRYNILNIFPRLGKILFRNKWKVFMAMRDEQERVLRPLIESRISFKQQKREVSEEESERVVAYVDTLLDLQLPEGDGKRKLTEGEMVSLCSEFLNAGTDTTSTALQWILANMVKYPQIQSKLYEEIEGVMGPAPPPPPGEELGIGLRVVREEDVQKMPYLKAIVLEGLRRHPPGHFVLPHSVSEEVELEGYVVPKNAVINFMVADLGWDPKVWKDPMEFKPERFINSKDDGEVFDITGNKEIKMMPFGAGRRICPGFGLAMLHLEYFVANLIWYYEWKGVEGEEVDLSEKQEFTVVMKNPLKAHISPRS
ncbi:hypothetical protein LguiA_031657 [Lonicera macranthoides]